MKKPHKLLLAMLQGPKVPKEFECDGCTMSPDAWFYWVCRKEVPAHRRLVHIEIVLRWRAVVWAEGCEMKDFGLEPKLVE